MFWYSEGMEFTADLTHVALVLFLAFWGGLFLERLRQPALVGYIIVGVLIGPGLLGLQGDDHTVRWLAELAVVLLMFMLGLELDLTGFRKSLKTAFFVALSQMILGVSIMTLLSGYMGWSLSTAILFGFVAALSSTAVALTILNELKSITPDTKRFASAVLIAQDVLVVPMLLVIGALGAGAQQAHITELFVSMGVVILSLWGIFALVRHPGWVERLERFFVTGRNQPVIAGMALCFGAAALSGAAGLSTAYGAFALGLLIGNVGTAGASYRSAIQPIHDFLMMVFFLSIGLMLDISFILENMATIIIFLGITVLLKTLVNIMLVRATGTSTQDAFTLGAVLGQVGEFSFVLIALGLSKGLLNHETYQLALAVIALSLIISPLWLSAVKKFGARMSERLLTKDAIDV